MKGFLLRIPSPVSRHTRPHRRHASPFSLQANLCPARRTFSVQLWILVTVFVHLRPILFAYLKISAKDGSAGNGIETEFAPNAVYRPIQLFFLFFFLIGKRPKGTAIQLRLPRMFDLRKRQTGSCWRCRTASPPACVRTVCGRTASASRSVPMISRISPTSRRFWSLPTLPTKFSVRLKACFRSFGMGARLCACWGSR